MCWNHSSSFVSQAIFICDVSDVPQKSFPSGHCTVSVLTTFTNHFVSVSANENILWGFSFDFCTLKKKILIKKLSGVSVFIGVGGRDVLFSVPEVLS